jgi:hypothetical protein
MAIGNKIEFGGSSTLTDSKGARKTGKGSRVRSPQSRRSEARSLHSPTSSIAVKPEAMTDPQKSFLTGINAVKDHLDENALSEGQDHPLNGTNHHELFAEGKIKTALEHLSTGILAENLEAIKEGLKELNSKLSTDNGKLLTEIAASLGEGNEITKTREQWVAALGVANELAAGDHFNDASIRTILGLKDNEPLTTAPKKDGGNNGAPSWLVNFVVLPTAVISLILGVMNFITGNQMKTDNQQQQQQIQSIFSEIAKYLTALGEQLSQVAQITMQNAKANALLQKAVALNNQTTAKLLQLLAPLTNSNMQVSSKLTPAVMHSRAQRAMNSPQSQVYNAAPQQTGQPGQQPDDGSVPPDDPNAAAQSAPGQPTPPKQANVDEAQKALDDAQKLAAQVNGLSIKPQQQPQASAPTPQPSSNGVPNTSGYGLPPGFIQLTPGQSPVGVPPNNFVPVSSAIPANGGLQQAGAGQPIMVKFSQ